MLHILFSLSMAAGFPVRGSLVTAPESSFVLGADTIRTSSMWTLGNCAEGSYSLAIHRRKTPGASSFPLLVESFPGHPAIDAFLNIGLSERSTMSSMDLCKMGIQFDKTRNMYVLHGQSRWALWMDSAWAQDTLIPQSGGYHRLVHPKVRWRWSLIEGTPPWVRWVDTLALDSKAFKLAGIPLLSLLDSFEIDSVAPNPLAGSQTRFASQLSLQADSNTHRDSLGWWLQKGTPTIVKTSWGASIPVGTTLYPQSIAADSAGTWVWYFFARGRIQDSVLVSSSASTAVRSRTPHRFAAPATGYDLRGRKLDLSKPLPAGQVFVGTPEKLGNSIHSQEPVLSIEPTSSRSQLFR